MKARAERVAETRSRIVAATVELHREVGPARTTVADIARRAGVERLTVYNHFPNERTLYEACQTHWLTQLPPPDAARHAGVTNPDARTEAVLRDLYGWYHKTAPMLRNVVRDAQALPALAQTVAVYRDTQAQIVELLLKGRGVRGRRRRRIAAALRLVLEFGTWDALTAAGLDDGEAAALAAGMVAGAR